MKRFPVGMMPAPSVREQYVQNQMNPIPHTIIHNPRTREVMVLDTIKLDAAMQNVAVQRGKRLPAPSRTRF